MGTPIIPFIDEPEFREVTTSPSLCCHLALAHWLTLQVALCHTCSALVLPLEDTIGPTRSLPHLFITLLQFKDAEIHQRYHNFHWPRDHILTKHPNHFLTWQALPLTCSISSCSPMELLLWDLCFLACLLNIKICPEAKLFKTHELSFSFS